MEKQKEILELKKLYLTQFEKFETKILLSWMSFLLAMFIAWIYQRISGELMISLAILTIFLNLLIESWRKTAFNRVIKEINYGEFLEI